jgi:hypothetical protein
MRTGEIRVIGLPNLAQQIITQQEKRKPMILFSSG